MIRWAEVQEVEKTSASSGEAELAEVDATSATCGEPELTAVSTPPSFECRHRSLRSVKLSELLLGFLDDFLDSRS